MKIRMRSDDGLGGAHLSVHPWFAQPGDEADVPEAEGWALVENGYADVLDIDDPDPNQGDGDGEGQAEDQEPASPAEDHQPETEQAVDPLLTEQRATAKAPVKRAAATKRSS